MKSERPRPAASAYWEKLPSVAVLDPAIATRNAGDEIISEAARAEILHVLPGLFQTTIPTHERLATRSYRLVRQSQYSILAGSNILTTDLFRDRGWRYSLLDTLFVSNVISLATGWRSYKAEKALVGKFMLKRALSSTGVHSVRDEYTRQRLIAAGVPNVVNTGCVTMFRLDLAALRALPQRRARRVVTTLNVHQASPQDIALAELLAQTYEEVFVWPQGIDDGPYVEQIFGGRAKIIGGTLRAYDELLGSEGEIDFIGNRLHGGIRAMQHKRRALILAVDNRAAEISKDTGLPVVERNAIDQIRSLIEQPPLIDITLPIKAIERWRAQFRS